MKSRFRTMCAILAVGVLTAAAAELWAAAPLKRNFAVHLTGNEEVPPVQTWAFGHFTLHASPNENQVRFTLITLGLVDTTAAHIHLAPGGTNGPVVAWLFNSGGEPVTRNGLLSSGTITDADLVGPLAGMTIADLLDAIRSGNAYVNVHTLAFPGGEIRAQIH